MTAQSSCRRRRSRFLGRFRPAARSVSERIKGRPHHVDPDRSHEIEAISKVDDRTDNCGLLDFRARTFHRLGCKIEHSLWIGFPKINSPPQPVIIVLAFLERITRQKSLGDDIVASVGAKHEAGSEAAQSALRRVGFCESASLRQDAFTVKGVHSWGLRFGSFLGVCFCGCAKCRRCGRRNNIEPAAWLAKLRFCALASEFRAVCHATICTRSL